MAQDAELWAHALDEVGKSFGESFRTILALRLEQKKMSVQEMGKLETFMKLPPETRKMMLQNPAVRQQIMQAIDPGAFKPMSGKLKKGHDISAMSSQLDMLGEPTGAEKVDLAKKTAESAKAQAEAAMTEHKARLATGVITPTAADLFTNFDFKDPLAAALAEGMMKSEGFKKDVTDLALFEKKGGPLYEKQQTQEWYGKMLGEGLPPGVAMQSAINIARGQWDKVPQTYTDLTTGKQVPVRGKAEQSLVMDMMNAVSRRQEVQNTLETSITTATANLAEKSGLTIDQARADIIALRSGRPSPFPTPHLTEMAMLEGVLRGQEVEKNTQTILNDKYGIGAIRETLNGLITSYKSESGYAFDGSKAADLKDKIEAIQVDLTKRLAERYGIKYQSYDELHPFSSAVRGAMSATWKGTKAVGAFGLDVTSDLFKGLDDSFKTLSPTEQESLLNSRGSTPLSRVQGPGPVHTPEQARIFKTLADSFNAALLDPNVPADKKVRIQKFVNEKFLPTLREPDKLMELFTNPLAESSAGGGMQ